MNSTFLLILAIILFMNWIDFNVEQHIDGIETNWKTHGKKRYAVATVFIDLFVVVGIVLLALKTLGILPPEPNKGNSACSNASVYQRDYPANDNKISLGGGTLRPFKTLENPDPSSQVTLVRNLVISILPKEMAPQSNGSAYSYEKEPKKEDLFTFYKTTTKEHKNFYLIEIGGIEFLVTLTDIVPKNKNEENLLPTSMTYQQLMQRQNFEYQFRYCEK